MTNVETTLNEIPADLVEIIDEQGNPTGQYRPRTAEDEVVYVTTGDTDKEVTVH